MSEDARRAKAVPAHQRRDLILAIQLVFINAYGTLDGKTSVLRILYSNTLPRFSQVNIECSVMNVLVICTRQFTKFTFDLVGKVRPSWFHDATVE